MSTSAEAQRLAALILQVQSLRDDIDAAQEEMEEITERTGLTTQDFEVQDIMRRVLIRLLDPTKKEN
ncbi:hypothetical protein DOU02_06660 [Clavibacter michiganensis subsp. michiganensis]|uniref:hypothetical protein n=1 Tax=Clavibacter michiganensis TaxID=28447 RepID=UPI001303F083|nr:hypothetical protein [Clavibacter michiganensis]KAF0258759.1 hypothetical protein DOU02_06660 [Clavibacter michiganensis subsp. michiganensis]